MPSLRVISLFAAHDMRCATPSQTIASPLPEALYYWQLQRHHPGDFPQSQESRTNPFRRIFVSTAHDGVGSTEVEFGGL